MIISEFLVNQYGNSSIVIYGATIGGKIILQCLHRLGIQADVFCDRSKSGEFNGLPVIAPDMLRTMKCPTIIIACTRSFASVCQYLEEQGIEKAYSAVDLVLGEAVENFEYEENEKVEVLDFLKKYPIYVHKMDSDKLVLPALEVFITQRCTLRCRDCSHLIPRYMNPRDYDIYEIIEDLKNVLAVVDYIEDLIILGGEPILHVGLGKLLEWAFLEEKIGTMTIISNGSVLPGEDVFRIMQTTGTRLRISDYGKYSARMDEIIKRCKIENVECFVNRELWTDMGEIYCHNYSEAQMVEVFRDCPFAFSLLLLNGRLYRCAHVAHLNNLGAVSTAHHDSVDFRNIDEIKKKRKELEKYMKIEYLMGCDWCNGIKNSIAGIEPAIQGKR